MTRQGLSGRRPAADQHGGKGDARDERAPVRAFLHTLPAVTNDERFRGAVSQLKRAARLHAQTRLVSDTTLVPFYVSIPCCPRPSPTHLLTLVLLTSQLAFSLTPSTSPRLPLSLTLLSIISLLFLFTLLLEQTHHLFVLTTLPPTRGPPR